MRALVHNRAESPRRSPVHHVAEPLTVAGGLLMVQIASFFMGDSPRRIRARNRSGMRSEEPIEEEPPGLVYDDRPPCMIKRRRPGPPQGLPQAGMLGPQPGAQYRLSAPVRSTEHPYLYPTGTLVTLVSRKSDHLWVAQTVHAPTGGLDFIDVGTEALGGYEGDAESYCIPPKDLEPKQKTEVAFAEGAPRPQWPLATDEDSKLRVSYEDVTDKWHGSWGRVFGRSREGEKGARIHVGVDLFADEGDIVLAMEPGEVIATLPFHSGTSAVYVRHDSGIVVNYGEVAKRSWKKYGVESGLETGQRVNAGQPIAEVGLACKKENRDPQTGEPLDPTKCSHMLHLETYTDDVTTDMIRREEMQWKAGKPPPYGILDPTRYLVRAQKNKYDQLLEAAENEDVES